MWAEEPVERLRSPLRAEVRRKIRVHLEPVQVARLPLAEPRVAPASLAPLPQLFASFFS